MSLHRLLAWPRAPRSRLRRGARSHSLRLMMEDLEERACPSGLSVLVAQSPASFVAGQAPSPLAQAEMVDSTTGNILPRDPSVAASDFTFTAQAHAITGVPGLYADLYSEARQQNGSVAAAQAQAHNVTLTFVSTLFSSPNGYTGFDTTNISDFLKNDWNPSSMVQP